VAAAATVGLKESVVRWVMLADMIRISELNCPEA
jgi:hypothetical protein